MINLKEGLKLGYTSKILAVYLNMLGVISLFAFINVLLISFTFLEMVQPLITKQLCVVVVFRQQVETQDSSKASYNGKFYENGSNKGNFINQIF